MRGALIVISINSMKAKDAQLAYSSHKCQLDNIQKYGCIYNMCYEHICVHCVCLCTYICRHIHILERGSKTFMRKSNLHRWKS